MAFGGGPPVPSTPPPPPVLQQPIEVAGMEAKRKAMGSSGQASTVKTGPEGLPPADTVQKTLLGQ